jgi:hypothetical protein
MLYLHPLRFHNSVDSYGTLLELPLQISEPDRQGGDRLPHPSVILIAVLYIPLAQNLMTEALMDRVGG